VSGLPDDPLLAELGAEFRAIAALLEESAGQASRAAAKRRIITLFRRVDGSLAQLSGLKEDIRRLVERYKQLEAEPATAPQVHHDHLGASTFMEKGWSLMSQGDHAGAIAALGRALELSPGDPQAQSLLGWAEMQSGRLDDALLTFSRVLVQEPSNALARVNVGYICLKKRVFGEAIEHLSRVIQLGNDPKATLYANYYLGLVYLERAMFSDAQSFLRQAIALGPSLVEAYYDLGRVQWLSGQQAEARATWTRGAAASRFSPWAKKCQELLDRAARGEEVLRSHSSS
jgi:tetratricopeptide (TPR) repeat protein